MHAIVHDMFDRVIASIVNTNVGESRHEANVNYESIINGLNMLGLEEENIVKEEDLKGKSKEEMQTYCGDVYFKIYDDKIEEFREQFLPVEKMIVLRTMDRNWIEHIDMMSKLREGIHLRSYAQNNPLQAYVSEGYEMFEEMMERIAREVVFFALKLQIQKKEGKA